MSADTKQFLHFSLSKIPAFDLLPFHHKCLWNIWQSKLYYVPLKYVAWHKPFHQFVILSSEVFLYPGASNFCSFLTMAWTSVILFFLLIQFTFTHYLSWRVPIKYDLYLSSIFIIKIYYFLVYVLLVIFLYYNFQEWCFLRK